MTTRKKIALVQCYIHHRKGVEVEIIPPRTMSEVMKLEDAYVVAMNYFGL